MYIHIKWRGLYSICGRKDGVSVNLDEIGESTCLSCINQLESMRPGSIKEKITFLIRRMAQIKARQVHKTPTAADIDEIANELMGQYNANLGNEFLDVQKPKIMK